MNKCSHKGCMNYVVGRMVNCNIVNAVHDCNILKMFPHYIVEEKEHKYTDISLRHIGDFDSTIVYNINDLMENIRYLKDRIDKLESNGDIVE